MLLLVPGYNTQAGTCDTFEVRKIKVRTTKYEDNVFIVNAEIVNICSDTLYIKKKHGWRSSLSVISSKNTHQYNVINDDALICLNNYDKYMTLMGDPFNMFVAVGKRQNRLYDEYKRKYYTDINIGLITILIDTVAYYVIPPHEKIKLVRLYYSSYSDVDALSKVRNADKRDLVELILKYVYRSSISSEDQLRMIRFTNRECKKFCNNIEGYSIDNK